jgi:hypothetical protein
VKLTWRFTVTRKWREASALAPNGYINPRKITVLYALLRVLDRRSSSTMSGIVTIVVLVALVAQAVGFVPRERHLQKRMSFPGIKL